MDHGDGQGQEPLLRPRVPGTAEEGAPVPGADVLLFRVTEPTQGTNKVAVNAGRSPTGASDAPSLPPAGLGGARFDVRAPDPGTPRGATLPSHGGTAQGTGAARAGSGDAWLLAPLNKVLLAHYV